MAFSQSRVVEKLENLTEEDRRMVDEVCAFFSEVVQSELTYWSVIFQFRERLKDILPLETLSDDHFLLRWLFGDENRLYTYETKIRISARDFNMDKAEEMIRKVKFFEYSRPHVIRVLS